MTKNDRLFFKQKSVKSGYFFLPNYAPTLLIVVLAVFDLYSCKKPAEEKPLSPETFHLEYPEISSAKNIQEVKTGVLSVVNSVDSNADQLILKQDFRTIFGTPKTPISIWYNNTGQPIKIEHNAASEAGLTKEVFRYYLKDGKPWFVSQLDVQYIFDNGNLKYWLQNWEEIENIPEENIKAKEALLNRTVDALLQGIH